MIMNKLIKEFAEQAEEYADAKLQTPGEYHPDWHDVCDERFAELIVRECINLVPWMYEAKIKEHFNLT
jgi:hypothetical protein